MSADAKREAMPESRVTPAHQTQVPAEVRRRLGLKPGDLLIWRVRDDGHVEIEVRKPATLDGLAGIVAMEPGSDAVATKKRVQRGQR